MKKIFVLSLLFICNFIHSQDSETVDPLEKKNELKINALMLVAGAFEVSYERLINEETSFGASVLIPFDAEIDTKYQATGFYRFYFGKKPAAGFFFEGFGMLNGYENFEYLSNFDPIIGYYESIEIQKDYTDFALGFGLGGKWLTNKGLLFELNGGIGRNLFSGNESGQKIVGRGGISVGYRF